MSFDNLSECIYSLNSQDYSASEGRSRRSVLPEPCPRWGEVFPGDNGVILTRALCRLLRAPPGRGKVSWKGDPSCPSSVIGAWRIVLRYSYLWGTQWRERRSRVVIAFFSLLLLDTVHTISYRTQCISIITIMSCTYIISIVSIHCFTTWSTLQSSFLYNYQQLCTHCGLMTLLHQGDGVPTEFSRAAAWKR